LRFQGATEALCTQSQGVHRIAYQAIPTVGRPIHAKQARRTALHSYSLVARSRRQTHTASFKTSITIPNGFAKGPSGPRRWRNADCSHCIAGSNLQPRLVTSGAQYCSNVHGWRRLQVLRPSISSDPLQVGHALTPNHDTARSDRVSWSAPPAHGTLPLCVGGAKRTICAIRGDIEKWAAKLHSLTLTPASTEERQQLSATRACRQLTSSTKAR
jgi:hypothetical protein